MTILERLQDLETRYSEYLDYCDDLLGDTEVTTEDIERIDGRAK